MQVITVQKHHLYDTAPPNKRTLRRVKSMSYQIVSPGSGIILQGPQWLVSHEYDLLVNGPAQPMPDHVEIEGHIQS